MNYAFVVALGVAFMIFGFYGWYFQDFSSSKRGIYYGTSEANGLFRNKMGLLNQTKAQWLWFSLLIGVFVFALVLDLTGAARSAAEAFVLQDPEWRPIDGLPWWSNPWWLCVIFGAIIGAAETRTGFDNRRKQELVRREKQDPALARIRNGESVLMVLKHPNKDYMKDGWRMYYYSLFPWIQVEAVDSFQAYDRIEGLIIQFAHDVVRKGYPA